MNTYQLMDEVGAMLCRTPNQIHRELSLRIGHAIEKETAAGVARAYRTCAASMAKLALRQRSKAGAWPRHHMRRVARGGA